LPHLKRDCLDNLPLFDALPTVHYAHLLAVDRSAFVL
jgi:hypothetical protein